MKQSTPSRFVANTDFQIADTTSSAIVRARGRSRAKLFELGFVFFWFFIGGIAHFAATETAMRIVPPYIPWPRGAALVSGVFELSGAFGLLLIQGTCNLLATV